MTAYTAPGNVEHGSRWYTGHKSALSLDSLMWWKGVRMIESVSPVTISCVEMVFMEISDIASMLIMTTSRQTVGMATMTCQWLSPKEHGC